MLFTFYQIIHFLASATNLPQSQLPHVIRPVNAKNASTALRVRLLGADGEVRYLLAKPITSPNEVGSNNDEVDVKKDKILTPAPEKSKLQCPTEIKEVKENIDATIVKMERTEEELDIVYEATPPPKLLEKREVLLIDRLR